MARPNAPGRGDYSISADSQEVPESGIYRLKGHVVVELFDATLTADEGEYDENARTFTARGNVYYRNYPQNEVIYCDSATYNTDTEEGRFEHPKGFSKSKIVARPGVLTTQQPFFFEGAYALKKGDKYLLYDGTITDCRVPSPWWTVRSRLIDIIPNDRAIAHQGLFRLDNVPVFYFPVFYRSLKKEPRKSGFTTPEAGHSSLFGYFFGLGYYQTLGRTMDVTYLFQDYTSRGYAHHIDFRGKPTARTDFDLIFYGVQDRGVEAGGTTYKAPGVSVTGVLRTAIGDGWIVRGQLDYLSSLAFRQTFTSSFTEAIFTTTNSSAYIAKDYGYYDFDVQFNRNQNFETATPGDYVIIRKLPEIDYAGREQQLFRGSLPLWFSFDSSMGFYHRVEPTNAAEPGQEPPYYETSQFTARGDLEPSLMSAFRWGGFDVTPSFTLHETFYGQQLVNNAISAASLNRFAPQMTLSLALPAIEKVFNRKTIFGDKLKHVMEPRIRYDYITGVNQFQNTLRFDTVDLLSDTNQVQFGLTNRIYSKSGDAVKEILTWDLYQELYFDPTFGGAVIPGQRNVVSSDIELTGFAFLDRPRRYSPVVSNLRLSPLPGIGFNWQANYDPLLHRVVASMAAVDYHFHRYYVSAGNNILKPDPAVAPQADQARFQFGYGDLNRKGWNYALSTLYDFRLARQVFTAAQITYNTDCCGISFEWRRADFGIRDDTQYKLAFTIANIGTFGNLKKQERLF